MDSACLKPLLFDHIDGLEFFLANFELSSPTSRGFRHLAVVIIAPDTTSFGKDFW